MVSPARRLLVLLALTVPGCSEGDDGGDGSFSASNTAPMSTTGGATALPTTGDATGGSGSADGTDSTGDDPPTTGVDATTTTTTGVDDTTTTGAEDSTGPICEPGQPNCVCDNGLCIDGYVCMGGACMEAFVCDGDVEVPGESEETPTMLDDVTDDDDEFHQISGVLSGAMDTDWYRYLGTDTFGHIAEPTIELLSMGAGMRVCQFVECVEGGPVQTTLTCPAGTKVALSPTLRPGCCHDTGFTIDDFACPGDEDMQVFIRLDMPESDTCVDYEFKLHY